jgi:hypothetical protein
MAQVLAPGVAQMSLNGVNSTQPWSVILHWAWPTITQPWNLTDIQALADGGRSAWSSALASHCSTQVFLQSVQTVDIGSPSAVVGSNTTAVPGTNPGAALGNAATCALMSFTIPARYKGGHPRAYLPCGTGPDILDNFEWSTTFITAMHAAWTNFQTAVSNALQPIGGQPLKQVCPRYTYDYVLDSVHHKYHKIRIEPYKGTFVVNGHKLQQKYGTQRRRLSI